LEIRTLLSYYRGVRLLAQEEYGLRCLVALARRGSPASLGEVARSEGLGLEYAAKLMQALRRGGLVLAARGRGGGYRLARPPEAITVWEALEVLGGPLFPEDFCACHAGCERACVHTRDCALRALWRSTSDVVRGFLETVTLADLLRPEPEMVRFIERPAGREAG
jgi:Rrf2 family protein